MKILIAILLMCLPSFVMAMNHEGRLDGARERNAMKSLEREGQLHRDLLGRKLVITPNSEIDEDSLQLDIAPGSTVILNVRQKDYGAQTVSTPYYRHVELP